MISECSSTVMDNHQQPLLPITYLLVSKSYKDPQYKTSPECNCCSSLLPHDKKRGSKSWKFPKLANRLNERVQRLLHQNTLSFILCYNSLGSHVRAACSAAEAVLILRQSVWLTKTHWAKNTQVHNTQLSSVTLVKHLALCHCSSIILECLFFET